MMTVACRCTLRDYTSTSTVEMMARPPLSDTLCVTNIVIVTITPKEEFITGTVRKTRRVPVPCQQWYHGKDGWQPEDAWITHLSGGGEDVGTCGEWEVRM